MSKSIFDFASSNKDESYVQKEATYKLTPDGEEKVKSYGGQEREFAVLAALAQLGPAPATVKEIDDVAHLGFVKTQHMLKMLVAQGRVVKSADRVT